MQTELRVIVADTVGRDYKQSRDVTPGGRRWTVSDFETKKAILLAGMVWGEMPTHLIREDLDDGRLTALNVEGFPPRTAELFAMRKRESNWQGPGRDLASASRSRKAAARA